MSGEMVLRFPARTAAVSPGPGVFSPRYRRCVVQSMHGRSRLSAVDGGRIQGSLPSVSGGRPSPNELAGVQDSKRTKAVVVFWPAAFLVGGDDTTALRWLARPEPHLLLAGAAGRG